MAFEWPRAALSQAALRFGSPCYARHTSVRDILRVADPHGRGVETQIRQPTSSAPPGSRATGRAPGPPTPRGAPRRTDPKARAAGPRPSGGSGSTARRSTPGPRPSRRSWPGPGRRAGRISHPGPAAAVPKVEGPGPSSGRRRSGPCARTSGPASRRAASCPCRLSAKEHLDVHRLAPAVLVGEL